MTYLDKEKEVQSMIGQGQLLEAFDKFYADSVVMEEATGETFEGKAANRKREEQFLESLVEMHGGGVTAMTANEDDGVTMAEVWMDATFKDGNRMKMEQVSVKKWEGDHIVHEKFYYNVPGQ